MRLIDGDAMLARLEEWNTSDSTDKALYNFTMHRILEAPTIEPEPKWIPAKTTPDGWTILDNRIDKKMSILVTYETATGRRYVKQVEVGGYGCRGYVAKQLNGKIVAWMPLPEVYREEGEKLCMRMT